jgi:phospholipid transport system substrate-binding protein
MMFSARTPQFQSSQSSPSTDAPLVRARGWLAPALCLAVALGAQVTSQGVASAQPGSAQQFVEQRHAAAAQLLRRPAGDARNRELTRLFDEMLDFQELGRRALGRHWAQRTEAERTQFIGLLQQLVQRAYQDNLQRTLQFDVNVTGSEAQGDAFLVRTEARSRSNRRSPPLLIDYSVRQTSGRWKVFDIHTDGVSMVANYRSQFSRIIARDGWAGLITRMQTRVAGGGTDI